MALYSINRSTWPYNHVDTITLCSPTCTSWSPAIQNPPQPGFCLNHFQHSMHVHKPTHHATLAHLSVQARSPWCISTRNTLISWLISVSQWMVTLRTRNKMQWMSTLRNRAPNDILSGSLVLPVHGKPEVSQVVMYKSDRLSKRYVNEGTA